jgi:hypothetical protein
MWMFVCFANPNLSSEAARQSFQFDCITRLAWPCGN